MFKEIIYFNLFVIVWLEISTHLTKETYNSIVFFLKEMGVMFVH